MFLSIIIALYNTEVYIEKCIRSIYTDKSGYGMDEFEVIVINDGSNDQGSSIVRKLQNEYANLILIDKENGGQSSARNIGFKLAKGTYIFCLDSDDYVDSIELFKAVKYAGKNNLDLLPVYLRKYDENYFPLKEQVDRYLGLDGIITGGEFLAKFVIYGSMCRYLYKTSVIREHNLQLTEGVFHEDEEFVIKFISFSSRVAYIKSEVYFQVVRSGSTVNNTNRSHRLKLLMDLLVVVDNLNLHRGIFQIGSLEYVGISRKIEQLIISVFLRMKSDKLKFEETIPYIESMTKSHLFPIAVEYLPFRFWLFSKMLNNKIFRMFYFR